MPVGVLRSWCAPLGIAVGSSTIIGRDVAGAVVDAVREAAAALGHEGIEPLRRTEKGRPVWSPTVTGAIAHDADLVVAVLGPRAYWAGLGVDIERRSGLSAEDARAVLLQPGETWGLVDSDDPTVRFCAKEASFKAFAGLLDATPSGDLTSVVVDLDDEGFAATHPDAGARQAVGRWGVVGDRIVTLALVASGPTDSVR